jgi:hypothetical protein
MLDLTVIRYYRIDSEKMGVSIDITDPLLLSISGMDLLIQIVVINLLKTPGLDYLEPEIGAGLQQLTAPGDADKAQLTAESNIGLAIKALEYQLKQRQLGRNYPAAERLKTLRLDSKYGIIHDPPSRSYLITLDLESEAGETATIGVPVIGDGEDDVTSST